MPDLPALDVAIGLVFLYVVLALVCTTINESISTTVGLRARFLQLGILNLLSASSGTTKAGIETTKRFYGHPLVQGLIRPGRGPDPSLDPTDAGRWWRKPPYPSYLPSRTFVAALTDMAREAEAKLDQVDPDEAAAARARIDHAAEGLERSLAAIPNERLSEAMLALYRTAGGNAAQFQHAVEQWFDDSMERVSGWYKRKVQLILFVIATGVVCPPERGHAHGRTGALAGRRHTRGGGEEGRGSGARGRRRQGRGGGEGSRSSPRLGALVR